LDGGTYAGDARIDDLPPGQERLLSYGIDQTILVNSTANKTDSSLTTGKIVKGVLHLTYKDVFAQEYVAENKGEHDKTLIIEHPLRKGWKLVEPGKADETTDKLYRFKGVAPVGKATKLIVREEHTRGEAIAIMPMDGSAIESYIKAGEISQPVKDALAKAAQLKAALVDTQRQITERQQRIQQITAEQNRIRDNMKTVAQNSDYYNRLLKKLDEQETTLEKLQAEVQGLQKEADQQRKALEDYLGGLNVG
jgi:methyl-accepting chemotaxis protein